MATKFTKAKGNIPKDHSVFIRQGEFGLALVLTALIVYLHLSRVSHVGALWRDEVNSLSVSTLPSLSSVWSSLIYESFPLLSFLVIRVWVSIFTDVDISLRILGALLGLLILVALWANKRLLGYQIPLVSLALFALNPTVIQWGDSLRAYGIGSFFILLSYGLIWKVTQDPTPKRLALAALASALSVQSLYQNAFLLLAICLGTTLVCLRHRHWNRILVVIGIGVVSSLSLVPYMSTIRAAREIVVVAQFPFDFSRITAMFKLALGFNSALGLLGWIFCLEFSIIAFVFVVCFKRTDRSVELDGSKAFLGLSVMITATTVFLVFLKSTHFPTQTWYYIVLMSVIAMSAEVLIDIVARTTGIRIVRLVLVGAFVVIVVPFAWRQSNERLTNLDLIASWLEQHSNKEDFIVVNPWFYGVTFQRYYQGATPWSTLPPMEELKLHRYDILKEKMMRKAPLEPIFNAMAKALSSGNRVWLVGNLAFPPEGQSAPSLPPAPNGPHGWYSDDYLGTWTIQLGDFISSNVSTTEAVSIPSNRSINPYENVRLTVFKGWRR